jgi:hypothetical protein
MNGKKKKKKSASKPAEGLLARLFKGGGKEPTAKSKDGSAKPKAKIKPLTPLERSIQEIKHMTKVGESDPERLAMLLSKLLGTEQEKQRHDQEDFDQMVWDIVNKEEEAKKDQAEGDDPPADTSAN